DQKGHYYDKNFKITTKDKIEQESFENLPPKERGWCEWAVGAFADLGANKDDLIYYRKSSSLLEEIGNIYHIISVSQSEEADA
ncbi:hypothetical protein BU031_13670, partial [Staphylococcus simulans]